MAKSNQLGAVSKPLVVVVALLAMVMGGGAWAVSSGRLDIKTLLEKPEPVVEMSKQPLFKNLDKFVLSLANQDTQHYMMLELSLVSHDPRMPGQAKELSSVIRNALLKHFSVKTREQVQEELREIDGLQTILRDTLAAAAENYGQQLAVEKVLITNIVIQ